MLPVVDALTPVDVFHWLHDEVLLAETDEPAQPVIQLLLLFIHTSHHDDMQLPVDSYLPYLELVR